MSQKIPENCDDTLKFHRGKETYKIDGTEFILKHPTVITVGADLIIKTKLKSEDLAWAIPVHKEFLMTKIPYIQGLFTGDWRENKDDPIAYINAPNDISGDVVFGYLRNIYSIW